jgi:hypothetical protein
MTVAWSVDPTKQVCGEHGQRVAGLGLESLAILSDRSVA